MREVYLDNAATTAPYPDVIKAMEESLKEYGNPSSLHSVGERAYKLIRKSRETIASTLHCDPNEIYFTSGGTESDNWAIRGVAEANKHKGRHIITTAIEHKAVLKSCEYLSGIGYKISYVPVDEMGRVDPEEIQKFIRDDTILVSVMTGNNEIGTVQPIAAIGKICRDKGILLHTDAVQMYGQFKLSVKDMYVDLLSASGHKFHGPKGTGFLYVRDGVMINNLIFGGG
jgi:cysteine desulfurase